MILWALVVARVVAGVVAGVIVFFVAIDWKVDAWVPLLAASIVASAGVAAMSASTRSSHYRAWLMRVGGRPHGVGRYVFTQTLLGLPIVASTAFGAWAATFASLVAG